MKTILVVFIWTFIVNCNAISKFQNFWKFFFHLKFFIKILLTSDIQNIIVQSKQVRNPHFYIFMFIYNCIYTGSVLSLETSKNRKKYASYKEKNSLRNFTKLFSKIKISGKVRDYWISNLKNLKSFCRKGTLLTVPGIEPRSFDCRSTAWILS